MHRRDWPEPPLDEQGNQRDGKVTWYRAMNQETEYARQQERVGWGTRREAQRARDVRWRYWDTQIQWDAEDRQRGSSRYCRLCQCGTTISCGTFCDTCYDQTSLRDRFRRSRREWED